MKKGIQLLMSFLMLITISTVQLRPVQAEDESLPGEEEEITEVIDETTETTSLSEEEAENSEDEEASIVEEETTDGATVEDVTEDSETIEEETIEDDSVLDEDDSIPAEAEEEQTEETATQDEKANAEVEEEAQDKIEETVYAIDAAAVSASSFRITTNGSNLYLVYGGSDIYASLQAFSENKNATVDFMKDDKVLATIGVGGVSRATNLYLSKFYYYTHKGGLTMDVRKLRDLKLPNDTYNVRFSIPGTDPVLIENVNIYNLAVKSGKVSSAEQTRLSKLCLPAPTNVSISTNDNGDVVIKSSDTDWLKALAEPVCRYDSYLSDGTTFLSTDYIGGGFISFNGYAFRNEGTMTDATGSPKKTVSETDYTYDSASNTVIIPGAAFKEEDMFDGLYDLVLSAEGYTTYETSMTLDLKNPAKTINSSLVTASVGSNGDLVIECSNEDYLNSLIMPVTGTKITGGGRVTINGKDIYNTSGKSLLSKSGTKVSVAASTIKSQFGNGISGNSEVKLFSKGYDTIVRTVSFPYIITEGGNDAFINVAKKFEVKDASSVTWKVMKKVNGNYQEVTSGDAETKVSINGATCTVTSSVPGVSYRVTSVTGNVTDSRDFIVTAEGLNVTVTKPSVETYVGAKDVTMSAKATIQSNGGLSDISSALSYKISEDSPSDVATINESTGELTLLKQGEITVVAFVGNKSASTKYKVYAFNKSADLSYELISTKDSSAYDSTTGMEVFENYQIKVKSGSDEVPNNMLTFKSGSASIASVDATGLLRGEKKGSTKITVTFTDLDNKKALTIPVSVVDKIFTSISLDIDGKNGTIDLEDKDIGKSFTIKVNGIDKNGETIENLTNVKFVSSDKNVVAVDSKGVATIKKAGQAVITATVSTNPKTMDPVTAEIGFRILDFTPRLETNKITINKYEITEEKVGLTAAYQELDNAPSVVDAQLTGDYHVEYRASEEAFFVSIPDNKVATAKSGKQTLSVKMDNGNTYTYDFTVSVTAKLPSITVKTTGSLNGFTGEGDLGIEYSSKDFDKESIKVVPGSWFSYVSDDEPITLKDPSVKSGTIGFLFDGYRQPVEKKITFKVKSTKPKVKLENSTVTLYNPGNTKDIKVRFLDNNKDAYTDGVVKVVSGANATVGAMDDDGYTTITLNDAKNAAGTVILSYKEENWSTAIENKMTIRVTDKLPKAVLDQSTVTINPKYQPELSIHVGTDGKSDGLDDYTNSDENFKVTIHGEKLTVTLLNSNIEKGSFKLNIPAKLNGVSLNDLTLTVKVDTSDPKVSIKPASIKLNKRYSEVVEITPSLSSKSAYGMGIAGIKGGDDAVSFKYNEETGNIEVQLKDKASVGKYTYNLFPIFDNGLTSETPIKVTINVYDKVASVKASVKGSLNPLDQDSEVTAKIKLSNVIGEVEGLVFSSDIAEMEMLDDETVSIRLKNRNVADQKLILNPKFKLAGSNSTVEGEIKVTVKGKAPAVKLVPSAISVFDTTNNGKTVGTTKLTLTNANAKIKDYKIEINKDNGAYRVTLDKDTMIVKAELIDGGKVKAGSTQTAIITITWEGDVGPKFKTSVIKVNIKDVSGKVKPRSVMVS